MKRDKAHVEARKLQKSTIIHQEETIRTLGREVTQLHARVERFARVPLEFEMQTEKPFQKVHQNVQLGTSVTFEDLAMDLMNPREPRDNDCDEKSEATFDEESQPGTPRHEPSPSRPRSKSHTSK